MALDLTLLNPIDLERFLHIQSIVARQEEEAARIRALRDYYDGEHPVYLTLRQAEFIGKLMSEGEFEFSHNLVKSVVDTLRERLNVTGFTVNGTGLDVKADTVTPEAEVAAQLWSWWKSNRLDAQQIRLYRRALRDGKSYVMVDFDPVTQAPRFTLHKVDDGTTGIVVHRDAENPEEILFVNKYWTTYDPLTPGATGKERKTTYLPNQIRKYIRGGAFANWTQYQEPGDATWPLPWLDRQGKPLGIPIIEFENPDGSEVAQIIGLQDALNKSWLDLIAAADAAGFPIMVAEYEAGQMSNEPVGDTNLEDADEFRISPGRMIEIEGGAIKRIEAGDMSQIIRVIDSLTTAIAGVSRTPQYYLRPVGGSEVPSGEALKQLESGLVKRAEERQLIFGQSWEDVFAMAYRIQQTFGLRLPEVKELGIDVTWISAEVRNETVTFQKAEALKRLGVPDEVIWLTLGFSPDQIAKWKATQRSDTAANVAAIASAVNVAQQRNAPQNVPVARVANANGVPTNGTGNA